MADGPDVLAVAGTPGADFLFATLYFTRPLGRAPVLELKRF